MILLSYKIKFKQNIFCYVKYSILTIGNNSKIVKFVAYTKISKYYIYCQKYKDLKCHQTVKT